jgi:hypothetical protein
MEHLSSKIQRRYLSVTLLLPRARPFLAAKLTQRIVFQKLFFLFLPFRFAGLINQKETSIGS